MGRPRQYDEGKVLMAAAQVFWSKGYEATSTRDLSACTGLSPSCMYGAFGDKRKLFHRALDHYLNNTLRAKIERLDRVASPSAAVREFFTETLERTSRDDMHHGCFLVNTVLEASSTDTTARDNVAGEIAMIESFFLRRLSQAQQAGEIPSAVSPERSARQLLAVLMGIRVLARVRADHEVLADGVGEAFASMGIAF
jgi:TetR/AcrR family transcriptional repressor of nem operon